MALVVTTTACDARSVAMGKRKGPKSLSQTKLVFDDNERREYLTGKLPCTCREEAANGQRFACVRVLRRIPKAEA